MAFNLLGNLNVRVFHVDQSGNLKKAFCEGVSAYLRGRLF